MATRTSRTARARAAAHRTAPPAPPAPTGTGTTPPPATHNWGAAIGIVIGILAILASCAGLLWVGAQITDPATFSAEAKATIVVANAKATATAFARVTEVAALATEAANQASAILGTPTNTPTNAPTAAPTATPRATLVPATSTPAPPTAAPTATLTGTTGITGTVSLKYDNGTGDCMSQANRPSAPFVAKQTNYLANFICEANAAGGKQTDLEKAIVEIQSQAANTGAKVITGSAVTMPEGQAWVVWTSNAEGVTVPNDVAFPAGTTHPAKGQIWVLPPIGGGIGNRTFSGGSAGFWAVAVH